MNTYPVGSVVQCRFAFTTRKLTSGELAAFQATGALPAGVGIDPASVLVDYQQPLSASTLTGSSVIKDQVGAYHVLLPVTAAGSWKYRGRGVDSGGNPMVATLDGQFTAVRSF